jgi:hypothetical protein
MDNDNLTAYLFMSVITALFLGLIISSEEILKDRKILKRESFLNLSWFSYINSKIIMMFLISAIQTISFILVGNSILGIKGMTFPYWLVLFTTSCCANMIGLNLSSALNSVITIYILIPFILIPQLLFSGVLVKYEKLHISKNSSVEFVPLIGEMMPARWSFEALAAEQFKNNKYERIFFPYDAKISNNNWYSSFLVKSLKGNLQQCERAKAFNDTIKNDLMKFQFHIEEMFDVLNYEIPDGFYKVFNEEKPDSSTFKQIENYLAFLEQKFNSKYKTAQYSKDSLIRTLGKTDIEKDKLVRLKTDYYNKGLATFVLNGDMTDQSVEKPKRIYRKYEPGYMPPTANNGRAHFCAPFKMIGSLKIDTFWFNLIVVWVVSVILHIALYFNLLRKILSGFDKSNRRKSDSNFLIIKEISSW